MNDMNLSLKSGVVMRDTNSCALLVEVHSTEIESCTSRHTFQPCRVDENLSTLEKAMDRRRQLEEEESERAAIIRYTLIETADLNYLVARQAYWLRSGPDFWWLSLQAIEKYLKATLLLNGLGTKETGHDVVSLLRQATEAMPFIRYDPPHPFGWVQSHPTTIEHAVEKIHALGSPGNRYNESGYQIGTSDLFHVDSAVLSIRAWCRSFRQYDTAVDDYLIRPLVASGAYDWRLQDDLPLELAADDPLKPSHDVLVKQNVVFDDRLPREIDNMLVTISPFQEVYQGLRSDDPLARARASRLAQWAIENIKLDRETSRRLRDPSYEGDQRAARSRVFSIVVSKDE
jgi:hypothetical protein